MQNNKEFGDLSVSLMSDVTKACDNDPKKAAEMLRALKNQEKVEQERKIKDLQQQFNTLPREVIAAVLAEHNYDEDAALVPLFNKVDEVRKKQEEEAKKKRVEETKQRRETETKRQTQYLLDIFQGIPVDVIQKCLDENEGDLQETTNQLLVLVQQKEDEERNAREKKRQEDAKAKSLKVDALTQKFPEFSQNEVTNALEAHEWDIKSACKFLVNYSFQKKFTEIKVHYTDFSDDEVKSALEQNNCDSLAAIKALNKMRETRKTDDVPVSINVTKIEQSLLDRSVLIGKEVENVVNEEEEQKKRREQEAIQQFKQEVNKILKVQAQTGNLCPGLVPPPLPKQIDAMLGKKKPVEEDDEPIVTVTEARQPTPFADVSASSTSEVKTSSEGKIQVSLKATPENVDCKNNITINWEVISGTPTANDWIGFYQEGQPNKQYITYQWKGKEENKGSLTFVAPTVYGVYEFRYFPGKVYEHVAMSNKVTVGPQIDLQATYERETKKFKVTWNKKSGNDYSRSWIGLFEKSKTHKEYITYEYASKGTEITFDAPVKPAEYEFRFFSYSYVDVARSNTLIVEGEDKVSAAWDNGKVILKVSLVSVDPQTDGVWVGIFFVDQQDNKQWRRYKYIASRTDDVTFDKPPRTGGVYEARIFANKTYQVVAKSNQIDIPNQK